MPTTRLPQFRSEIARARDLVGLGQSLGALTHGLVSSGDLYRAALVHSVAALDSYVHGVVLDRALAILLGRTPHTPTGTRVGLHFNAVQQILNAQTAADQELAARTHLAQRLSLETFQHPEDIGTAFAMVGTGKLWSSAFQAKAASAKTALGLVVQRRNRIVHQCDADPLSPGQWTPISDTDTLEAIAIVESTVMAIDAIL